MRLRMLLGAAGFCLKNFAVPIAFFLLFEWKGTQPAIAVAVLISVVQLVTHLALRHKVSPFFLTAAFFTVLFGGLDLVAHSPQFFRLAPFAENLVMALLFAGTVIAGRPIATWFAQALPSRFRPALGQDMSGYLRKVTWVWAFYFLSKALLFLYLAFRVSLGELIVLRSAIGGGSLVLMVLGEVFYRTRIRSRRLRVT